ncbi:MAG: 3'-5' exonuclease domain-containing protein 2 [Rikenellaceae bacterium]|jgi:ribonuclease D|nr:3'-5' exonuclease domain-containing protein 2 [Rikenellaceae bacterium]
MEVHSDLLKIDNQALEALPSRQFPGRITVVDGEKGIKEACERLMACRVVGFDTETRPAFTAGQRHKVALLQLSSADECFLFRLCKMPLDKQIVKVLTAPGVMKVGAAVRDDLKALQSLRHFKPEGFLDLQHIIRDHGIDELGLRKMAAAVLGYKISKAQRLSNWEAASLTPAQQLYAATDAWVSREIYIKLEKNNTKAR